MNDVQAAGGVMLIFGRSALRLSLLWAALALPFVFAAAMEQVAISAILAVLVLALAYLLFWAGLAALVSRLRWTSVTNAAVLASAWLLLVLIVPTLANVAINPALPIDQGAEIALAQREEVNRAWDIPRDDTMRRFYVRHPEWSGSAPLGPEFHYKWYLAFHQNGDESVAERVRAYPLELTSRCTWLDRAAGACGGESNRCRTRFWVPAATTVPLRST
jgi:ABC-2 type transport system permease protein